MSFSFLGCLFTSCLISLLFLLMSGYGTRLDGTDDGGTAGTFAAVPAVREASEPALAAIFAT